MYPKPQALDQHRRSMDSWHNLLSALLLNKQIRRSMPGLFTPDEERRYELAIDHTHQVVTGGRPVNHG